MGDTIERFMHEVRLGDVIDDYCIKCRRLTNHSVVSIVDGKAAKVRCRTCYNDHDNRFEQAPPSKKDLKKAELFKEVLASVAPTADGLDGLAADAGDAAATESGAEVSKKGRGRIKKAVDSPPPPQP